MTAPTEGTKAPESREEQLRALAAALDTVKVTDPVVLRLQEEAKTRLQNAATDIGSAGMM